MEKSWLFQEKKKNRVRKESERIVQDEGGELSRDL